MRKLLNNPLFVAIAALGALLVVGQSFIGKKKSSSSGVPIAAPADTGAALVATADGTGPTENAPATGSISEMLKNLRVPSNVRDPFAQQTLAAAEVTPLVKETVPDLVDSLHLSAVWIQKGSALVLINGHIFQTGEEVGRIKIESATPEGVWLSHWKGRDFLSVGRDFTLNTPAKQSLFSSNSL